MVMAVLACATPAAARTTPFVAIHRDTIAVPRSVQPWLPTWTADGKHILFQNQLDGATWITGADGRGTHCISCSFTDRPQKIVGGFTYAFPDNKRIFVSKELGSLGGGDDPADADAYVLECAPSIVSCRSHRYLPVDMSADKGASLIVQRRTWHLAPDGVHLGWMDLRADGTAMIVARLTRAADRYMAADPRVVNPVGPRGNADTDPVRWENQSQLYELKSFVDGGRAIVALGERAGNIDQLKIDLRTGRTTRLTANPDWDEDGALSPDGDLDAVYSWRTRHRLDATGWIPQIRAFTGLEFSAALAPYYVSTWQGFQCDLSPWLLPGSGDRGGTLTGQPLATYAGNLTPGNNLSGQWFWSPDSTRILLQERLRTKPPASANEQVAQKGLAPNRIAIARLDRAASRPAKAAATTVGAWAPPAAPFPGTLSSNRTVTVHGLKGGSATIVYQGTLLNGSTSVTFDHYTDDGKTFVDGTMSGGNPDPTSMPWALKADVTVSGAHTGRLRVDLVVDNNHKPLPAKTGTFAATYDGKTAPPLPELGQCYAKLPKPAPLALRARAAGGRMRATVTATIAGDRRPVQSAVVRVGGRSARTNSAGHATLAVGRGRHTITASAGDTFRPARVTLR
jgi:hypothetical protein